MTNRVEIQYLIERVKELEEENKKLKARFTPMKPYRRTEKQINAGMSEYGCDRCCCSIGYLGGFCITCGQAQDWSFLCKK